MFAFEHSIFINRPQQEVFDFLSNPGNGPKWNSSTESAEWTSEGPHGVGSTQRSAVRFLGRKIDATSVVTIWDPPHQIGYKLVKPVPYEITMKLESQANGTQLTGAFQGEFGGFFRIAEGLVSKQAEKEIVNNFDALKLLLESSKE